MTRKQLIFNLAQWAVYETCQRIPFSSNNLGGLLTEKKNLLLILSRADLNTPIAKIVRAWNINPSDEHQFEPEFKNHEFEINGKKYSYSQIYKRLEKNTRLHKINYIHPSTNDRRSLCKMEEDSLIAAQFGIGNCTEKSGFAMTLLCEYKKENTPEQVQEYLDELAFLAETAGAVAVKSFTQRLDRPDSKTFVGKGKLEEIGNYVASKNIDLVIFDDELSGSQLLNISEGIKYLNVSEMSIEEISTRVLQMTGLKRRIG